MTTITRRGFVRTGGALFVSLSLPGCATAGDPNNPQPIDPERISSWLEIHSDNTIVARTGKAEIGTGMSAFYAQMIAEELRVQPEAITLIMGDTDKTPDGGYSAGFLYGAANVRKAAAYTYQALLSLAAGELRVQASDLTAKNGVFSGGGRSVAYGQLIAGRELDLKIPIKGKQPRFVADGTNSVAGLDWAGMDGFTIAGDPPLKPVSEFECIGKSFPMPGIPAKVTGKTRWSCDVALPGMLHARMIRPQTLGSALISIGALDKTRFPTAQIVRKANLLAILSSGEWEAVQAARAVSAATKWTEWSELPASAKGAIRAHKWGDASQTQGNAEEVAAELARSSRTISASYEQPYVKHAPIGPYVAVADVRPDGLVTVWTHSSHSQALRARIANLLGTTVEKVVVRWLDHAGQFGRTTFGGDGAEADAVILSQLTGKPVRVQWTLQEDLAWSAASPAWVSDVSVGLDANGCITAFHSAFYSPHMFDARPVGAILAGMPAGPSRVGGFVATEWPYDKISKRLEQAYAMPNIAADTPSGGIRGLIMRTPGQRQQNFALESAINEAAAVAAADPIQFRLKHTNNKRLIEIVNATAQAAQWKARPSPAPDARKTGHDPVAGRGIAAMIRGNGYWVGIAEILVTPATGAIQIAKFTIGVDCGKVINPRQLDRCMKGGVVMGLSEALKEEVTFDQSKITSTDWSTYKILTMQETPEIRVVQLSRDDCGFAAGGEAPNALAPPAVAAAFFDATGVTPRRIPLTPAYVTNLLTTATRR